MNNTKGSVVIYVVLLMFVMMTSAAIVLSSILSKHIRASENYVSTERAFAAANSGIEEMLYKISKEGKLDEGDIQMTKTVEYDDGSSVQLIGEGCGKDIDGEITPHLTATGSYRGVVRRISFGGGADGCDQ